MNEHEENTKTWITVLYTNVENRLPVGDRNDQKLETHQYTNESVTKYHRLYKYIYVYICIWTYCKLL